MASPSDNKGLEDRNILHEEEDMSIAFNSDEFLYFDDISSQTDPSLPFTTTLNDQDEFLKEILNGIKENVDNLDRTSEEQGELIRAPVEMQFITNTPSPYLAAQWVPNVKREQELESGYFANVDNTTNNDLDESSTTAFDCQHVESEARLVEKPRRVVAPTDENDEEPLLLYDQDINKERELETTFKSEELDQADEFFMLRKDPFSVNHAEYISVKSQDYQDQFLDELFQSDVIFMPTTFTDPSFSINFSPKVEYDEEDFDSWLCFDNDKEYQEFKKDFEKKYTSFGQVGKVEKGRGAGRELGGLSFVLGEEFDRGMKALSRRENTGNCDEAIDGEINLSPFERRQKSDKIYYNDNGFIYSKRH
ncbi:unnamed protein product [Mucor hiemalis]